MYFRKTFAIKPKIAGYIFLTLTSVFLIINVIVIINTRNFILSSVATKGEIIDTYKSERRETDGSTSISVYAIIKFQDSSGHEIIWKANSTSNDAIVIGKKVNIRYELGNPENASYDSFIGIWFGAVILSIFIVLFLGFGVAFCYYGRTQVL